MSNRTFLIKLAADNCPGVKKGFPRSAAEWEGKEFDFPTGPGVKEYPNPGDLAYIWIHEKPGRGKMPGAGLCGRVTVQPGTRSSSFTATNAKLFRFPIRADEMKGRGPFISEVLTYRPSRMEALSASEIAELDHEIVLKEQTDPGASKGPQVKATTAAGRGSDERESLNYYLILQQHGFSETKKTKKTVELWHPELDTPVYLKLSPSGEYVHETPIVIHPGLAASLSNEASLAESWSLEDDFYHMSNMTAFPTRIHGGEGETHYGTAVRIPNRTALDSFIMTLLSTKGEDDADDNAEEHALASMPQTERMALTKARRGQGKYRYDLLALWIGCSVTNVDEPLVLTASHIKRWSDSTPTEKLDPYNGFLLTPNLDRLFEHGLITFLDDGKVEISPALTSTTLKRLGLQPQMSLRHVFPQNLKYLEWHRQHRFRGSRTPG